ncbi:hypothetical protein Tco_0488654 [Tanacetum coccineum]
MSASAYIMRTCQSQCQRSRNLKPSKKGGHFKLQLFTPKFLEWRGFSREAKSRYNSRLTTLLLKLIYSPQIVDWQLLHKIGCGDEIDQMLKLSLKEAQSDEEIFFSVAWVKAFNIREPIYPELCREFYATYEFDEVCADDELQSKKIISFRLGGRAHSLTLLEFARRLGLYHAEELEEEGFDTYFQGGLRSDENFNAREYWERISIDRDLHLFGVNHSLIHHSTDDRHQNGYANVAWVICRGQFISKIARKSKVLTEETIRSLSTPELIPEILIDDVPRVAAQRDPRVQRASMQDLYECMGSMEIRHEAIERMEYRHAYHWDSPSTTSTSCSHYPQKHHAALHDDEEDE